VWSTADRDPITTRQIPERDELDTPELKFGATMPLGEAETAWQARWLEDLGFDYVAVGEHFMRGNPPSSSYAALPLLGVAAGATERIRLLSSVLLVPFYHPTVLAKLATSLDVASDGRLTLGVGVGGEFPVEFEAAGLNVKQRGRRTNECLEVMRRLWTEEHVTYQGVHFRLDDVTLNPRPAQNPHPPIWVAGRRDAAITRAALFGDGWLPYFYSPERYRDSVEKITITASEHGRDLQDFQWASFPYISIYETVDEAAAIAADILGGQYLSDRDFIEVVRGYCLLGPVERCVDRMMEYYDAGVRQFVFTVTCPLEDRTRHIETISKELIPAFRERVG
jgi:probable F420-dependent oxidoreductase